MAVLYVVEYAMLGREMYGGPGTLIQAPLVPPQQSQVIAIGSGSVQCTNTFDDLTTLVQVSTDAICSIAWGTNPNAKNTDHRMAAGSSQFFAVPPGKKFKVAVITNS